MSGTQEFQLFWILPSVPTRIYIGFNRHLTMGNFFSTSAEPANHNEIEGLKQRLTDVERLDRNQDGIVSKEEFELWLSEQKKDIEKFKKQVEASSDSKYQERLTQNERALNDTKLDLHRMKVENEALKSVNQSLEKRLKDAETPVVNLKSHGSSMIGEKQRAKLSNELSKKRINKLVDELLADPDVNIKYFPDGIERQIYRNVFTIMINLLDNLVDTTSVNFMGHKLVFDLQPLSDAEIAEDMKRESLEKDNSNTHDTTEESTTDSVDSAGKKRKHKRKHKFKA